MKCFKVKRVTRDSRHIFSYSKVFNGDIFVGRKITLFTGYLDGSPSTRLNSLSTKNEILILSTLLCNCDLWILEVTFWRILLTGSDSHGNGLWLCPRLESDGRKYFHTCEIKLYRCSKEESLTLWKKSRRSKNSIIDIRVLSQLDIPNPKEKPFKISKKD